MAKYEIHNEKMNEVVKELNEADNSVTQPDTLDHLMAAQAALMDTIMVISEDHHDHIVADLDERISEQGDRIAELKDEVAHTDKTNERMREQITTLENERLAEAKKDDEKII